MEETEKLLSDKNFYPCQLFVEDLKKTSGQRLGIELFFANNTQKNLMPYGNNRQNFILF